MYIYISDNHKLFIKLLIKIICLSIITRFLEYRKLMDILRNENSEPNLKRSKHNKGAMKSVCRLMPIDDEQFDDLMKEQQIDEIRKKLKIINMMNEKNKNINNRIVTDST